MPIDDDRAAANRPKANYGYQSGPSGQAQLQSIKKKYKSKAVADAMDKKKTKPA